MTQLPRLYLITDDRADPEVVAAALAGVPPGAAMVQLRAKQLPVRALVERARALRAVTAARGCPLLVNDRLDVALAVGADGVQLPETGLDVAGARAAAPGLLVGASTHSTAAARACPADVVVLGPIWPTPGKPWAIGPGAIAPGCYAVGGIETPERAAEAVARGARGVAVIRAVMSAPDPGAAARALLHAIAVR